VFQKRDVELFAITLSPADRFGIAQYLLENGGSACYALAFMGAPLNLMNFLPVCQAFSVVDTDGILQLRKFNTPG